MISAKQALNISQFGLKGTNRDFPREIKMNHHLYYLEGEIIDSAAKGDRHANIPFEPYVQWAKEGSKQEDDVMDVLIKQGFTVEHRFEPYGKITFNSMLIRW